MSFGSIPINTIFSGMNIHKSQLFWGSPGVPRVLTHCQMSFGIVRSAPLFQKPKDLTWSDLIWPRDHLQDASASARVDLLGLVHFLVNEEDLAWKMSWWVDGSKMFQTWDLSLSIYILMVIICYTMLYFIIIGDNNNIICFDMSWWHAHVMGNGPRARAPSTAPCQDEALAEAVKENSLALLDGILLPNCSWRRPMVNLREKKWHDFGIIWDNQNLYISYITHHKIHVG